MNFTATNSSKLCRCITGFSFSYSVLYSGQIFGATLSKIATLIDFIGQSYREFIAFRGIHLRSSKHCIQAAQLHESFENVHCKVESSCDLRQTFSTDFRAINDLRKAPKFEPVSNYFPNKFPSVKFPRFALLFSRKIQLVPDNADLFSFLRFFSFPSCVRGKYLHKTHIRSHIQTTFVHLFTRWRIHSPARGAHSLMCSPPKKKIYYTFFSDSSVCMYFLNINMFMIFPSFFSFSYFLCGLYTSRVQLHTYFYAC